MRIGWQVEHVAIEKVAQVFNEVAHGYHCHRTIVVVNQRDVTEALQHHAVEGESHGGISRQSDGVGRHKGTDLSLPQIDWVSSHLLQHGTLSENADHFSGFDHQYRAAIDPL